jgi:serine/threonine-protein kinase
VLATIFKPGSVFEHYKVLELLDHGYMGEVYQARDLEAGREVALKFLRLHHLENLDIVRRARMEALALAQLHHPNIVRVYETGVTDSGMVWMAMELLKGKTLRALLRAAAARVPVQVALKFVEGIAEGVAAAHRRGIIHRDLKPENIFVTHGYEIRVLDLGTAKFLGYGLKTTDHLVIIGTLPYMSPEHISGQPVDVRTDVYAVGIMLFEMLAGKHPFAEHMGSPMDLGAAQMFTAPPRLSDVVPEVPDFVAAIAHRAMAKRREGRFPSMAEMGAAVRAALGRYVDEGWASQDAAAAVWRRALDQERSGAKTAGETAPVAGPKLGATGGGRLYETAPIAPGWRSAKPVLPFRTRQLAADAGSPPDGGASPREGRAPEGAALESDVLMRATPATGPQSPARTWSTPWRARSAKKQLGWTVALMAGAVSASAVVMVGVTAWSKLRGERAAAPVEESSATADASGAPVTPAEPPPVTLAEPPQVPTASVTPPAEPPAAVAVTASAPSSASARDASPRPGETSAAPPSAEPKKQEVSPVPSGGTMEVSTAPAPAPPPPRLPAKKQRIF